MDAQIATGSLVAAAAVALVAGFVSFASPCVLPLVPGFLGYVTGLSDVSLERRSRGRLVLGAVLFVLGFTVVFLIAAAAVSTVGLAFREHQSALMRIGGAVVLVMGLMFLGLGRSYAAPISLATACRSRRGARCSGRPSPSAGRRAWVRPSARSRRWPRRCRHSRARSVAASRWPPSTRSASGLPFVLMAALWERAGRASDWLRDHRRALQTVGGLMLVAVGLLMLTGVWEDVIVWLQVRLISGFQVAI